MGDTLDIAIVMMAGPLRNGAERGHGSVWHAVPETEQSKRRGWIEQETALCGRYPSIMWSSHAPEDRKVTCPRCLKKLATPLREDH